MRPEETAETTAPPEGLSAPRKALWWLAKGGFSTGPEWERAHEICQSAEGERDHDLVHAVAHLIEGDVRNADYWFSRAGEPRNSSDPRAEWERAEALIG